MLQFGTTASTLTLLYVSGSSFQADWIDLTWTTAVEATAWGAVKQLFQ